MVGGKRPHGGNAQQTLAGANLPLMCLWHARCPSRVAHSCHAYASEFLHLSVLPR
jgi:hypothetical protein